MTDFNSWALNGPTDAPDATELDSGFICDRAPRDLFNWLVNAQSVGFGNRFMSIEAIQNTPPVSPSNGETWIIGTSPTGVWVGKANQIATWLKDDWVYTSPKPWQMVGLADRTDWRWDHTLGEPAWVKWAAGVDVAGPIKIGLTAPRIIYDDDNPICWSQTHTAAAPLIAHSFSFPSLYPGQRTLIIVQQNASGEVVKTIRSNVDPATVLIAPGLNAVRNNGLTWGGRAGVTPAEEGTVFKQSISEIAAYDKPAAHAGNITVEHRAWWGGAAVSSASADSKLTFDECGLIIHEYPVADDFDLTSVGQGANLAAAGAGGYYAD